MSEIYCSEVSLEKVLCAKFIHSFIHLNGIFNIYGSLEKNGFPMYWMWVNLHEKIHLKQHMRQCHGFKKYKCNQCNFRSDDRSNVLRHIKFVHEKINFKYDQCDFKCIQKDNLKQHIKCKHLEKNIKCDMEWIFSNTWFFLVTLHCLVFCNHKYICFHKYDRNDIIYLLL